MEIWLQKPMTSTSLMNMETLTPEGAPGGIFKLRSVAQMLLVAQAKTRHVQKFLEVIPYGSVCHLQQNWHNTFLTRRALSLLTLSVVRRCFRELPCALCKELSMSLKSAFKTEVSLAQFAFCHLPFYLPTYIFIFTPMCLFLCC